MHEPKDDRLQLARAVQEACIHAAQMGYEQAAISGLCGEGAFEAAISAIRMLDLGTVVKKADKPSS